MACQTFFRCRRPLPTPSLFFFPSSQQQLQANRCKSLANSSIALITGWPKRLHERLLNMKRAWSDASAGTKALLETRAALIGCVRSIMHEHGCVGCSTAWNATSLSLLTMDAGDRNETGHDSVPGRLGCGWRATVRPLLDRILSDNGNDGER
ncbi:hypothetical protein J3F84DRAFT_213521 [Trichoderma pleuroticola]